jgi:hypothetical protein
MKKEFMECGRKSVITLPQVMSAKVLLINRGFIKEVVVPSTRHRSADLANSLVSKAFRAVPRDLRSSDVGSTCEGELGGVLPKIVSKRTVNKFRPIRLRERKRQYRFVLLS